jgi:hypothetical protein
LSLKKISIVKQKEKGVFLLSLLLHVIIYMGQGVIGGIKPDMIIGEDHSMYISCYCDLDNLGVRITPYN